MFILKTYYFAVKPTTCFCDCFSPGFVLVTVSAGDPPKLIQNNAAVKKNIIHTNPNFHMQIRLSQQSLSPSHHFLHSNAFSLLYKIPLSARRRGCARFVRIKIAISARLPCRMRRCTMETAFCMLCSARFIARSQWRQ